MRIRYCVVVILCMGFSQAVRAGFDRDKFQLEVGGISAGTRDTETDGSIGKITSTLTRGTLIQAALVYRFQPYLQSGIESMYVFGLKPERIELPDRDGDGIRDSFHVDSSDDERKIFSVGPIFRLGFNCGGKHMGARWPTLVYITAGAGGYYVRDTGGVIHLSGATSGGTPLPSGTTISAPSNSSVNLGESIGAGVDVPLFSHIGMGFDYRYHFINSSANLRMFTLSLRLAYLF